LWGVDSVVLIGEDVSASGIDSKSRFESEDESVAFNAKGSSELTSKSLLDGVNCGPSVNMKVERV
jgi:hypothetical protein